MSDPQLLSAHVGNWTGDGTGVTVILPPPGTVGSGEVRGGAPATREFDLLDPVRLVDRVDAVVLSGGSAFGLAAADGVMRLLRERGTGYPTAFGPVPIVVGMSIFDESVGALPGNPSGPPAVGFGSAGTTAAAHCEERPAGPPTAEAGRTAAPRNEEHPAGAPRGEEHPAGPPTAEAGRAAALAALRGDEFRTGVTGAGTGARTGKWRGRFDPGGLGRADGRAGTTRLTALAVVNAWGDVLGPDARPLFDNDAVERPAARFGRQNTTIAVLITDAQLSKADCQLLAQSGHTGFARALHPAHSRYDGDAVVALATGEVTDGVDLDLIRAVAAEVMAEAIRAAVTPGGVDDVPPE
ncbi:P1 family peptidase [Actinoplanes sp. NPDC020271]|uniref:P1 family peptidase n=1 Tax=Actinoplanes sp. NPDC020271 TaxID=3363896 RepID=UPI0037896193